MIIRNRRSAVDMDGASHISRDAFYRILLRICPHQSDVPFSTLPWNPTVHLALFVHRVDDLAPGLYLLARRRDELMHLKDAMRGKGDFAWRKPPGCPDQLELYELIQADARSAARTVSCQQDIAADGVFAVAMLARFEPLLEEYGPWFYKRLFWETGVIGQTLYLEAEAAGIRGTGIGCFFDDSMHEILGIADQSYQSLYHFTVGGPVDDPRLKTLAPYEHLEAE
jgi:nitroreductase